VTAGLLSFGCLTGVETNRENLPDASRAERRPWQLIEWALVIVNAFGCGMFEIRSCHGLKVQMLEEGLFDMFTCLLDWSSTLDSLQARCHNTLDLDTAA
jgi:hypothetical protein